MYLHMHIFCSMGLYLLKGNSLSHFSTWNSPRLEATPVISLPISPGIQTLTNQKQGHCYGVVASWSPTRRRRLGVHLLHRALLVFLAEGERELRPQDIQACG